MSTIKVNKIENTSTTDGGISIDNSGDVQMSGKVQISGQQMPTSGPLSNRNIFINGAMNVAQRATSVTGINSVSTVYATVDRMYHAFNSLGTWTSTQESDAPDGFVNSLKVNCTTADSSLDANDYAIIVYRIEGQDLQQLSYGNSGAQDTTISFYVKSNKTGTASFEVSQADNSSKQIVKTYTIDAANTWEYKTITIPGDTAGVINNDNGVGFQFAWWLHSGSDYQGSTPSGGWETADNSARNNTSLGLGEAVNDYFQITGIQFEVGSKATPFEHLSYAQDLHKCQRYFLQGPAVAIYGQRWASNDTFVVWNFPVQMRNTPTITGTFAAGSGTLSTNFTDKNMMQQYISGYPTGYLAANSEFSAEL